jgi:hypothetical protein
MYNVIIKFVAVGALCRYPLYRLPISQPSNTIQPAGRHHILIPQQVKINQGYRWKAKNTTGGMINIYKIRNAIDTWIELG